MRTNSIQYAVLETLARSDSPMTCEEIWEAMEPENRPAEHTDRAKVWGNLSSHAARLYGNHYVDRRKRDVKWRPMEYWVAAKGREELRANGDLPEDEDGSVPAPENPDADPGETAEEPNPSAIRTDLGLDDPEIDTAEALTDALAGIVSRLRDVEAGVDNLRETAVTEAEMEDRLRNSVGEGLRKQVQTLQEAVNALAEAQSERDGTDSEFGPYIRRLRALDRQGYGLYEADISTEYGGNVQEVRVKAKPKDKTDQKGPAESDGERVTVQKGQNARADND